MRKFKTFALFRQAMQSICDRPSLLWSLWENDLSVDEAANELRRLQVQGLRMFKDPHRTGKIPRKLSLEQVQSLARKGVLKAFRELGARRMAPDARAWLQNAEKVMGINRG